MSFLEIMAYLFENWLALLSILVTAISLIITIIKTIKNGKTEKVLAVVQQIPALVAQAETTFGAGHGEAKLNYVLTQLQLYALNNGVKVDTAYLTDQINSVVATTKVTNVAPNTTATSSQEQSNSACNTTSTQIDVNI